MNPVRLLIADDHALIREGLKAYFSSLPSWRVVAELGDLSSLEQTIMFSRPEMLILDLRMPGGDTISCIQRLSRIMPDLRILVLSAYGQEDVVNDAIHAGAHGFLGKESSPEEIEQALLAIRMNKQVVSFRADTRQEEDAGVRDEDGYGLLSIREKEVFQLLSRGVKNKEIARRLFVSPKTIDVHRANILKKLDASSTAELVQVAVKRGITDE